VVPALHGQQTLRGACPEGTQWAQGDELLVMLSVAKHPWFVRKHRLAERTAWGPAL